MDSRERVAITLAHEVPDRIPMNFRAVDAVVARLTSHFRTDYEGLLRKFDVDFREVIPPYIGRPLGAMADGTILDYWGIGRTAVQHENGGRDLMVTYHPLRDVRTVEEVRNYSWPTADMFDFSAVPGLCDAHAGYSISTHGIHIEGYHGVFHLLTYLFGMENGIMYLGTRPDLIEAAIDEIMKFFLSYYDAFFSAAKGRMDLLFYKDDFGTQNSQLISAKMFNDYFFPTVRDLADLANSHRAKFVLHSCGAVSKLIPGFIEAGVSVLDPIQVTAKNMDIVELKRQFGKDIVFHGAIDTQRLLPGGTAEEVQAQVRRTIEILGKGGGYFFSPAHRIQADTPTGNILAAYEAAAEAGVYTPMPV